MKTILGLVLVSSTLGLTNYAMATQTANEATYKATKNAASSEYKIARSKCNTLSGNPKDVCVAQAKAARVHAEENAEMHYKNTVSARTSAIKAMAKADYEVAIAKCDSQAGNAKDVCVKQAKAAMVTAISDAKAKEKISDARTDAREDKLKAEYKAAVEKCDALSGDTKDACVASAKTQFGQ